jgi:drug/metabolite transporter (DMT)-like permease
VTFLVPVFAVFYGVLYLGEAVTPWMLLCAAVIVLGTALSTGLLQWPQRLGRKAPERMPAEAPSRTP